MGSRTRLLQPLLARLSLMEPLGENNRSVTNHSSYAALGLHFSVWWVLVNATKLCPTGERQRSRSRGYRHHEKGDSENRSMCQACSFRGVSLLKRTYLLSYGEHGDCLCNLDMHTLLLLGPCCAEPEKVARGSPGIELNTCTHCSMYI